MAKKRKKYRLAKKVTRLNKSFISGYKRSISVKSSISSITRNAMKSRLSIIATKQRKTRFKAKKVNEYLQKLQKWGRYDTWASKQLISRLDVSKLNLIDDSGLINMNKISSLTETQMINANRAMDLFVSSKTKTIQGINAVVKKKKQDLIEKSDNPEWVNSLSNKEIEDLYRVFDDHEFEYLSEKIKYELLWNSIIEAKANNYTQQEFIDQLQLYTDEDLINDDDVRDSIVSIYDRYVVSK